MPTSFDEVLLDPEYSADADGGPEWATAIVRSFGGAVAHRNENSEDYVSKYEIKYANLSPEKKANLRGFSILRKGRARGFRFLAADDYTLTREAVGVLDAETQQIGYMTQTDGTTTVFYLIKNYSDAFNAYNRRIVKLSPFKTFTVELFNAGNLNDVIGIANFAADPFYNVYYGSPVAETKTGAIGAANVSARALVVNYHKGTLTITPALPAGLAIRVTGEFHLPVAFMDDWQKYKIDEQGTSEYNVSLEEILPVELGID